MQEIQMHLEVSEKLCRFGDLRREDALVLVAAFPRDTVLLNPKLELLGVRLSLSGVRFSMSVFETQSASIPLSRRLNGVPDLACPVPGFRCLELPPLRRRPYASTHAPQADPRDFGSRTCLPDPWTKLLSKAPCAKALSKASHKGLAQSLWPRSYFGSRISLL